MTNTAENTDLIIPNVNAVALETTQYWERELAEKAGRIFEVYLYDENRHVHACSFRAMYELHWADVYPENRLDGEDHFDLYNHALERGVSYHAVSEIDALKEKSFPEGMFYDERVKHFGSPSDDVWREQVQHKGKEDAHADHMRHSLHAYNENPLFA